MNLHLKFFNCWSFEIHNIFLFTFFRIKYYIANLRLFIFNGPRRSVMLLVFHLEVVVQMPLVMLVFKTWLIISDVPKKLYISVSYWIPFYLYVHEISCYIHGYTNCKRVCIYIVFQFKIFILLSFHFFFIPIQIQVLKLF